MDERNLCNAENSVIQTIQLKLKKKEEIEKHMDKERKT